MDCWASAGRIAIEEMKSHRRRRSITWLISSFGAGILAISSFIYPWRLVCTQARVINIYNPEVLKLRHPPGFISQSSYAPELFKFRTELAAVIMPTSTDLEKAVAIRKWARAQQIGNWAANDNSTEDPVVLLNRQRQGVPGCCRRFAYVLAAALVSAGLDARVVGISAGIYDSSPNHTLVEVWISEASKWVLVDSMYNTMYLVDGRPASLLELYETMIAGDIARVKFERNGSTTEPTPRVNREFIGLFHDAFYSMTNATFDNYRVKLFGRNRIGFAHFTTATGESYPETLKEILIWLSVLLLAIALVCASLGILELL